MTAQDADTCIVSIRVHPRSSKNRHERATDDTLHVWVTAAAVDGAANKALIKYLADVLSVPVSRLALVSGETSRSKRVRVPVSRDEFETRTDQQ